MPAKIAAANWKMNGLRADLGEVRAIAEAAPEGVTCVICPPATLLAPAAEALAGTSARLGGQTAHPAEAGAHTGDVSAPMLADAGCSFVILGHSERRADHAETDAAVAERVEAAWRAGLVAILCIGESLEQREAGDTLSVLEEQLAGSLPDGATPETTVIAYEPIWAIGTGKVASPDQIAEVHDALRIRLASRFGGAGEEISLLYGGSVKAANAAEIFALGNVDGGLVGGASLKASDFGPIMEALAAS
jgi:triosephosphate isomerase